MKFSKINKNKSIIINKSNYDLRTPSVMTRMLAELLSGNSWSANIAVWIMFTKPVSGAAIGTLGTRGEPSSVSSNKSPTILSDYNKLH